MTYKQRISFHDIKSYDELLQRKQKLKRQIEFMEQAVTDQVMEPIEIVTSIFDKVRSAYTYIPIGMAIGKFIGKLFRKRR